MAIAFNKYHGTGNDFIVIDDRAGQFPGSDYALVARLCRRRFGVGADGLMLLREARQYDFEMVYYNADGKPGSMCGNGGRCMVAFAQSLGLGGEQVRFLASDGPHEAWQHPEGIALAMGAPSELMHLSADHFEVNTGSPHYIVATEAPLETLAVEERGAALRYAAAYQPDGINVNFAQFDAEGAAVRTYERGVEAETWSCGTGAVAVALVWAARFQAAPGQQVPVRTRGGLLHVQLPTASQPPVLIGPAQFVFQGALEQDERHRPEQPATEATRPA